MTGAELKTYLERRLREEGAVFEADRALELFDALTDARDLILQEVTEGAPVLVRSLVPLEADADGRTYSLPEATLDPYQWIEVRTGVDELKDTVLRAGRAGHYEQLSLRSIRLNPGITATHDLEAYVVPAAADITTGTAAAAVGLPTTFHRVIAKLAAVLIHTQGEEDAANKAMALFRAEVDRLMGLGHNLNRSEGYGFRDAFARGYNVG